MADHEIPVLRRPDLGQSPSETAHGKAVSEAPMARASQDPLGKGVSEGPLVWGLQAQMAWCCSAHGMGLTCVQWQGGVHSSHAMGLTANSTSLVRYGTSHGMVDSKGPWHRAQGAAMPHLWARPFSDRFSKISQKIPSSPGKHVRTDLRHIRRRSSATPLHVQNPRCARCSQLKTTDWSPRSALYHTPYTYSTFSRSRSINRVAPLAPSDFKQTPGCSEPTLFWATARGKPTEGLPSPLQPRLHP